jgi:hypothetical protein
VTQLQIILLQTDHFYAVSNKKVKTASKFAKCGGGKESSSFTLADTAAENLTLRIAKLVEEASSDLPPDCVASI